jgi:hypothetical protein
MRYPITGVGDAKRCEEVNCDLAKKEGSKLKKMEEKVKNLVTY